MIERAHLPRRARLLLRSFGHGPCDSPGFNGVSRARCSSDSACDSALRLAPHEPAYQHTRGWLLIETGRIEEGFALVRSAATPDHHARRSPANVAEVTATLALGEAMRGDHRSAGRLLAEAEALDPRCRLLPRAHRALSSTTAAS